jgi:hypothetical protein
LSWDPLFLKKNRCRIFLAAVGNFANRKMRLFHGQASYGEANYHADNYRLLFDDHLPNAIK